MLTPMSDPQAVQSMFARIAGSYDLLNRVLSCGIDRRWRKRVVARAGQVQGCAVLDVCTGTGCVPVAIASNCESATLTAIELDDQVHHIAQRNIEKNGLTGRISLLQGDLFSPLSSDASFEVITANPPYVTDEEMDTLQLDVRLHEPQLALRGGADGLDIVRRLIAEGGPWLANSGALLLEIGEKQSAAVTQLFADSGGFEPAQIVKKNVVQ